MATKSSFWKLVDAEGNIVDAFKETIHDWEEDLLGKDYNAVNDYETGLEKIAISRKEFDAWVAARPEPEYYDILGRRVKVGSRVAVAFALGRGAEIRVGRVVKFDLVQSRDGGYNTYRKDGISGREQIVVEWEADNRNWGSNIEQSKIFAALRRYVVVE